MKDEVQCIRCKCGAWEEFGADEPRHYSQTFEFIHYADGTARYKCQQCGKLTISKILPRYEPGDDGYEDWFAREILSLQYSGVPRTPRPTPPCRPFLSITAKEVKAGFWIGAKYYYYRKDLPKNLKSKHRNVVHQRKELRWRAPFHDTRTSLCGLLDWCFDLCETELPVNCQHCLAKIEGRSLHRKKG